MAESSLNPNIIQKWSIAIRVFHWLGALMILSAWFSAEVVRNIGFHKALGVSFLLWTIARLVSRFVFKAPTIAMPKWQTGIAHATHGGLYLCMFAMPISGLLMTMYAGRETSVFGLFNIPMMVAPDGKMAKIFNELHTDIWWVILLVLLALHIGGALYHQFVLKDNLISRMK